VAEINACQMDFAVLADGAADVTAFDVALDGLLFRDVMGCFLVGRVFFEDEVSGGCLGFFLPDGEQAVAKGNVAFSFR